MIGSHKDYDRIDVRNNRNMNGDLNLSALKPTMKAALANLKMAQERRVTRRMSVHRRV